MKTILHGSLRVIACALIGMTIWWIGGGSNGDSPTAFFLCLFITIPCILLLARPLAGWFGELGGKIWMPSDSSFIWQPQYSVAEARVKQGRYKEAIELFRQYIVQYPEEITPHLRIADLQLAHFKDYQAAISELQAAVSKARSPDGFAFANIRLADLYLEHEKNSQSALACLQKIQRRYPMTKHADTAKKRAEKLLLTLVPEKKY